MNIHMVIFLGFLTYGHISYSAQHRTENPDEATKAMVHNLEVAIDTSKPAAVKNILSYLKRSDIEDNSKLLISAITHTKPTSRVEIIKLLLDNGAQVNVQAGKDNNSALMYAVLNGLADVVDELLWYQPDMTIKNEKGQTVFDIARERNNKTVLKKLSIAFTKRSAEQGMPSDNQNVEQKTIPAPTRILPPPVQIASKDIGFKIVEFPMTPSPHPSPSPTSQNSAPRQSPTAQKKEKTGRKSPLVRHSLSKFKKFLLSHGFWLANVVGSHEIYKNAEGKSVAVAKHGGSDALFEGFLKEKAQDIGWDVSELNDALLSMKG